MKRLQKILHAFLCVVLIAGCTDNIEQLKLTKEDRERILLLQNPFGSNIVRINTPGKDGLTLIGLQNCKVYRAEPEQGVVTEWVHVPEVAEFYPLPSDCNRESVEYDGEYVTIKFCKTPMGAGGGCAGGISPHRSRNGKDWEVLTEKGKWQSVGT